MRQESASFGLAVCPMSSTSGRVLLFSKISVLQRDCYKVLLGTEERQTVKRASFVVAPCAFLPVPNNISDCFCPSLNVEVSSRMKECLQMKDSCEHVTETS